MEADLVLTSIAILVLVITSTAKSALDEMSDLSLRRLATEAEDTPHAQFWQQLEDQYHQISFTLTLALHLSIASIAILTTAISLRLAPQRYILVSLASMIVIILFFRLILPLLVTQNDPGRTLLRLRTPLRVLISMIGVIAKPMHDRVRLLRRNGETAAESSEEEQQIEDESELQAFLHVGADEGIIDEKDGQFIQSIIRFNDRTVIEVMTPRPKIVAVEAETPIEQVRDLMIESKYSRLPVYNGQIDHIEGLIYVRDLLRCWAENEVGRPVSQFARRQLYEVPESKPIDQLMMEMQKAKAQMALVIDEYGGLAGLVTLEDLIEEIVGEIEDEDEPEPIATEVQIVQENETSYTVRGDLEVGKLERQFNVELAADDFTTVAGLVLNRLGHLPNVGERLEIEGLRFEILEADDRRISRVRVEALPTPETETNEPSRENGTHPE